MKILTRLVCPLVKDNQVLLLLRSSHKSKKIGNWYTQILFLEWLIKPFTRCEQNIKGLCFSGIKNLKFKKHKYTGGGWILRTNKIRSRLNSRKILRNVVSISQEFCWRTFFFGGFWGYLTLFLVPNSTDLGTGVVSSSKTRCCFAHSKIDCRHARVPINHKMSLKLWGQDSGWRW